MAMGPCKTYHRVTVWIGEMQLGALMPYFFENFEHYLILTSFNIRILNKRLGLIGIFLICAVPTCEWYRIKTFFLFITYFKHWLSNYELLIINYIAQELTKPQLNPARQLICNKKYVKINKLLYIILTIIMRSCVQIHYLY